MENDIPPAFTDDAIRAALDRADADIAAGRVVSAQRVRELLSGQDGTEGERAVKLPRNARA